MHINLPTTEVMNSGAELPAAMNVAPATSACSPKSATGKEILGLFEQILVSHY